MKTIPNLKKKKAALVEYVWYKPIIKVNWLYSPIDPIDIPPDVINSISKRIIEYIERKIMGYA